MLPMLYCVIYKYSSFYARHRVDGGQDANDEIQGREVVFRIDVLRRNRVR